MIKAGTTLTFGNLVFRIHWLVVLCVLFAMGGLVRLGIWQLGRAQEKIAQQESFVESGELQATPLTEVPTAGIEFDLLQHQNRRVVLRGEYLNEQAIFLIYQTFQSQVGWEVVTPVRVAGLDLIDSLSWCFSSLFSESPDSNYSQDN